jgi:hypothetical protein
MNLKGHNELFTVLIKVFPWHMPLRVDGKHEEVQLGRWSLSRDLKRGLPNARQDYYRHNRDVFWVYSLNENVSHT